MRIRASSTINAVNKRLVRLERKLDENGKATTEDIAKLTKDYILRYIPRKTGESADSISYASKETRKGYSSVTVGVIRIPHEKTRPGGMIWRNTIFNIPRWMFTSNKAFGHFRTGNVAVMRNVVPEMTQRFFRQINLDVAKIIKEEGFR